MFSLCQVVNRSVHRHFPSPRLVMESGRKRKLRQKEFTKEQLAHFKKLRKEQNKRRRKRKKCPAEEPAEELKVVEMTIPPSRPTANARHNNEQKSKLEKAENCLSGEKKMDRASVERSEKNEEELHPSAPANASHSDEKKRRPEEAEKNLPRGKKMVRASLQGSKKNGEGTVAPKASRRKVHSSAKPKESDNTKLREISAANLTRAAGATSIGSGTFGTCYPGKYRGIDVVIKQYKERSCQGGERLSFLQREAKHEANVLLRLGDHPGIPFLFGVCLKEKPVSIVMKFHGDGKDSLTVYKAAKNNLISEKKEWNTILCETADALDHVHRCGYAHNDLKSNNVVLEKREDERLHPVIIDFGKSVLLITAKNPPAKPMHVRSQYKDSYIAPELVDGTGKPSAKSDIYALSFLIKSVYRLLRFRNVVAVKNALVMPPEKRPTIKELKAALSADD